jgi:hypothetical protein
MAKSGVHDERVRLRDGRKIARAHGRSVEQSRVVVRAHRP